MKARKRDHLSPIPRRSKRPADPTPGQVAAGEPDLSYISANLRPHAVPIADVAFLTDNPRKHGEHDLEATKASLRTFGQVEMLVVNKRPTPPIVLNGNGRLAGALSLGWSHVAVNYVDLDQAQANALAVALNRTGELAGWDATNLAKALDDIATGNDAVLDEMIAGLAKDQGLVLTDNEFNEAIHSIEIKPPFQIVWILLGIPFAQFGTAQHHLAALQEISSVSVQSNRDQDGQPFPVHQGGVAPPNAGSNGRDPALGA